MSSAQPSVTYKDIPGHAGYRVGDDGSVWSCRPLNGRGNPSGVWRRLKFTPARSKEYFRVALGGTTKMVHRLVIETFVGPCPDGMECCHFPDRNPANNALYNLRWDTKKANADDRRKHGTDTSGGRNGRAKLTDETVRAIRADHETGQTTRRGLASKYAVSVAAIDKIIRRTTWKHI